MTGFGTKTMTEDEELAVFVGSFVGASMVFGPVMTWLLINL